MTSQPVIFDLADSADERFDPLIEGILVGLLAFMPLALGAVHPWSELVVVAGAGAMALILAVKLLVRPDVAFVRTWAYVPVLALLALVMLQFVPLPAWLVRLVSPATVSLRADLMKAVPGADAAPRFVTLSLYPEATLGQLRLLLAVCAVFVVAVNVVRRLRQVKRMLGAVAAIGAAVALLALAQDVADAERIYWLIPIESNRAGGGPFVNPGHFAQFMNLSMGAALGLMLVQIDQLPTRRRRDAATPSLAAETVAQPLSTAAWLLACAAVAMAVAVPLSMSRGGMLSMLVAGLVTALVVATRRGMRRRAWIFAAVALAALAVVVALRFEAVAGRVSGIGDPQSLGGRVDILRGSVRMWRTFPLLGTGLGTFAFAFPGYDPSTILRAAAHAENEYAQLAVETGAVGLALALALLVVVAAAYVRCVRGAPSPMASAAAGLGFGIVAILVHSAADFGQHLPANAVLAAVTFALLINLAHATKRARDLPASGVEARPRAALWPRAAGALVAALVVGVTVFDAARVWRADLHRQDAIRVDQRLARSNWRGDDADFARLILSAQAASEIRPRDVELRYDVNRYRWKALARGYARRAGAPPLGEEDRRDARRVVDELLACPRLCPTYAPPYLLAGEILRGVFDDPAGAPLIRTARRLAPTDPEACIADAVLDAEAGDWEAAVADLGRAVALSADHRDDVIDVIVGRLGRPDVALRVAWDDRAAMLHLLSRLDESHELKARAQKRADELLFAAADKPDAGAAPLAEAAYLALGRGERAAAIQFFRRATAIEYSALDWRIDLARAYAAEGRRAEAVGELHIILGQSPAHAGATALLAQLNAPATQPRHPVPATATTVPTMTPAGFRFD